VAMHKPPHPGEILGEDILPALSLTITAAAVALDISRKTLSVIAEVEQNVERAAVRDAQQI